MYRMKKNGTFFFTSIFKIALKFLEVVRLFSRRRRTIRIEDCTIQSPVYNKSDSRLDCHHLAPPRLLLERVNICICVHIHINNKKERKKKKKTSFILMCIRKAVFDRWCVKLMMKNTRALHMPFSFILSLFCLYSDRV